MKPRLLFISPVTPAGSGNGRAMRAAHMLSVLARRFEVSLLIVESRLDTPPDFADLDGLCRDIRFLPCGAGSTAGQRLRRAAVRRLPSACSLLFHRPPEWAPVSPARIALATAAFPDARFDAIHVFRLHLAPYAAAWMSGPARPARLELDLDDVESVTRGRIARLHRMNRQPVHFVGTGYESVLLRRLERIWLPRFDRVWVCSEADAVLLRGLIGGVRADVAPNVVCAPDNPLRPPPAERPFRFLFTGTLGYYPNQDALLWFMREVLPVIRRQADRPFCVTVAGAGLPGRLARRLRREPGMDGRGFVQDLPALYRETDTSIVPLRAGGGSRIKILDAFAQGVPVLSTPAGAEGLSVQPEVHLLLASTAGDFAAAALRMMKDPGLRSALAREARRLVAADYSPALLARRLLEPA